MLKKNIFVLSERGRKSISLNYVQVVCKQNKELIKSSKPKKIFVASSRFLFRICLKILFPFRSSRASVWQIFTTLLSLLAQSLFASSRLHHKALRRDNSYPESRPLSCLQIIIDFNTHNWLTSAFPLRRTCINRVALHTEREISSIAWRLKPNQLSLSFSRHVHAIHKSWAFKAFKVLEPWPQSLQPRVLNNHILIASHHSLLANSANVTAMKFLMNTRDGGGSENSQTR